MWYVPLPVQSSVYPALDPPLPMYEQLDVAFAMPGNLHADDVSVTLINLRLVYQIEF